MLNKLSLFPSYENIVHTYHWSPLPCINVHNIFNKSVMKIETRIVRQCIHGVCGLHSLKVHQMVV